LLVEFSCLNGESIAFNAHWMRPLNCRFGGRLAGVRSIGNEKPIYLKCKIWNGTEIE
jgi:hypothetical protein